jgi:multiple sugar transport system ATP-binding protein
MARVVFDNVTKEFSGNGGTAGPALRGVTLDVQDGELLVVLGPSGSGKSTLLRLIAGLEEVDGGSVSINGTVVNQVPPADRNVAMVFQQHALYPHLTAFENLALPLRLRNVGAAQIGARVQETADLLGLTGCLNRLPAQLSGGERQRVGLGRALIRRPDILLLDEPLSNLDAPLRSQLRGEMTSLHSKLGTTMLYVTHDQEEAMALGSRLAVLKAGELQQIGPPMEIYARPANQFVAGFVGSPPMNYLRGTVLRKGYTLFFRPGDGVSAPEARTTMFQVSDEATANLTSFVDRDVILGLRPEDIRPACDSDVGRLTAMVERVERLGPATHARLQVGETSLTVRWDCQAALQPGDAVSVTPNMAKAHYFEPATGRALGWK